MKEQQLYKKVDQEHERFTQQGELFSPQETYINENILDKPFRLYDFTMKSSPVVSFSILYAILQHVQNFNIPIPIKFKDKPMNERIKILQLYLLNHYEKQFKELSPDEDSAYIATIREEIRKIRKPIKGIGVDNTGDILLLARYFHVRIYVYDQRNKTWISYVPTNARMIQSAEGNEIYYYKERIIGNIFLLLNSKNSFDLLYPKLKKATLPTAISKEKALAKMKKKIFTKKPEKKPKVGKKQKVESSFKVEKSSKKMDDVATKPKRCPNGYRKNKETGECEKKTDIVKPVKEKPVKDTKPKEKLKRCPKGSRRNKKTGECEPVSK